MSVVFSDTSFYIAFTNPKDHWYEVAMEVAFDWRGKIVTTEYVLVEFGNHLCPHRTARFSCVWRR